MKNISEKNNNELELYLHIPFCVKKCNYCDFLSFNANDEIKDKYIDALINQIKYEAYRYQDCHIISVFIGGGTPSVLNEKYIEKIMFTLRSSFVLADNAEITIECNPGTLNLQKLKAYYAAGINRLSMGLQSTDDEMLKKLGRIHNYNDFLINYKQAVAAGFNNINVDIMSGLPDQTVNDWRHTLNIVMDLEPAHISAYSLIIEEGTLFYEKYHERDSIINDENDRKMYHLTKELLIQKRYNRYEISNYSKSGSECRHNIGYWKRVNYLGLGIGAASLYNNYRWKIVDDISIYINYFSGDIFDRIADCDESDYKNLYKVYKNEVFNSEVFNNEVYEDVQLLSNEDAMSEYMFLGLRLSEGVSLQDFAATFKMNFDDISEYRLHTEKMMKAGLLLKQSDRLFLSEKGLDLANTVMCGYII